jgi:hypothetical protein
MEHVPSSTPPAISSTPSERAKTDTKSKLATATEGAHRLFRSYRKGDANDPDGYVAAIASILTLYQDWVIRVATDPRTGIGTVEPYTRYMPNPGELKLFCDAIATRAARADRWRALPAGTRHCGFVPAPPDPPPGADGRHPPGTILANYGEAVRLYGKPMEAEGTQVARQEPPTQEAPQAHQGPAVSEDLPDWAR